MMIPASIATCSTISLLLSSWCWTSHCYAFQVPTERTTSNNKRKGPLFFTLPLTLRDQHDTDDARFDDLKIALRRMQSLQNMSNNNMFIPRKTAVVQKSSIAEAGMGVFALQNIKAGTLVGYYPVHAIGIEQLDDNGDEVSSVCLAARQQDQPYFDQVATDTQKSNYMQYLIGSRRIAGNADFGSNNKHRLFVDVQPSLPLNDKWISHFINDGATVRDNNTEASVLNYYKASRNMKNCVHIPFAASPIMATVTTRKVRKGEELFTTYGCLYWCADVTVTQAIQLEAKATAQDLLDAARKAQTPYATQQADLQEQYLSL